MRRFHSKRIRTVVRRSIAPSLVAVVCSIATSVQADTIVVPNIYATADAPSSTLIPPAPFRFMEIFSASQFLGVAGPFYITDIAFRPDATQAGAVSKAIDAQVFLSTTTVPVAGLSSTFAANLGADNTQVLDGTLDLSTSNLSGPGTTKAFDIVLHLTTPFLYDPQAGNLLLDFQASSVTSETLLLDQFSDIAYGRALFASGSATSETGGLQGGTVATEFITNPVPAPGSLVLLLTGAPCGIAFVRRRYRRTRP